MGDEEGWLEERTPVAGSEGNKECCNMRGAASGSLPLERASFHKDSASEVKVSARHEMGDMGASIEHSL
jgi:hypothetical protein